MPHPLEIPLILVDKSTQPHTEIEVLQPYFPAHELFGCMHTHYLPEFEKRILGVGNPTGSFTEYWRDADVENDPRLKHHPLRSKPDYKTKCVPCARHGDGVPYKKGLKGGVWTWPNGALWLAMARPLGTHVFSHGVFQGTATRPNPGRSCYV